MSGGVGTMNLVGCNVTSSNSGWGIVKTGSYAASTTGDIIIQDSTITALIYIDGYMIDEEWNYLPLNINITIINSTLNGRTGYSISGFFYGAVTVVNSTIQSDLNSINRIDRYWDYDGEYWHYGGIGHVEVINSTISSQESAVYVNGSVSIISSHIHSGVGASVAGIFKNGIGDLTISNSDITVLAGIGIYSLDGNVSLSSFDINNIVGIGVCIMGGNLTAVNGTIDTQTGAGLVFIGDLSITNVSITTGAFDAILFNGSGDQTFYVNSSTLQSTSYNFNYSGSGTSNLYGMNSNIIGYTGILNTYDKFTFYSSSPTSNVEVYNDTELVATSESGINGTYQSPYLFNIQWNDSTNTTPQEYRYVVQDLPISWNGSTMQIINLRTHEIVASVWSESSVTWTVPLGEYEAVANESFRLGSTQVAPSTGSDMTIFNFTIEIDNIWQNQLYVNITINGTPHSMTQISASTWSYLTYLDSGIQSYWFSVTDGALTSFIDNQTVTVIATNQHSLVEYPVVTGLNSFCYSGVSIDSSTLLANANASWISIWNVDHFEFDYAGRSGDSFTIVQGQGFFIMNPQNNLSLPTGYSNILPSAPGLSLIGNPTDNPINVSALTELDSHIVWVAVFNTTTYQYSFYFPGHGTTALTIAPKEIAWIFKSE